MAVQLVDGLLGTLEEIIYNGRGNDEDALIGFHLAGHVRRETAVAGIDLTRLQRASKGADHSTRGRRDHVVDGRRMGFRKTRGIHFVVLRDRAVHAEHDRLRLTRETRDAQRSFHAFDVDLRRVNDASHTRQAAAGTPAVPAAEGGRAAIGAR